MAQTKVRGKIIDAETKEILPFVNVYFKGSNISALSDFNGEYYLETRTKVDSIAFACVGYKPTMKVIQKNSFQTIDIKLEPQNYNLNEITVYAGENPAHKILKKIHKNKKRNDPQRLGGYSYEVYNKMEIDVNNIDDEFKQKKVFKHFDFVWDFVDTNVVAGKSYLPMFLSETLSDFYYKKDPKRIKEIIKANNISGIENESVSQLTGQMYVDINVYNNYLEIFEKNFISPIADLGLLTYKYFLIDSQFLDNKWCYQISFKPKRKQEMTFTGEFWVHDTTFAIKKIKARIAEDANINFINDFIVTEEYSLVDDSIWFRTKNQLFIDFNLSDKKTGFFGQKTTTCRNIKIGLPADKNFFSETQPEESIILDGSSKKDTTFWNDARHEKLSIKEEKIFSMVDSIKGVPVFRTFIDFVNLFILGYYVKGNFEIGPYYKMLSFNPIEGARIRFGGRTSNEFSTRLMLSGHLAYGTKDKVWKYGAGAMYMFSKAPRTAGGFYYKNDIEQLGQSINAFTEDNILSSILARNPKDKLLPVEEYKMYLEKEWWEGLTNTVYVLHRRIRPTSLIAFDKGGTQVLSDIVSSEITLSTRFAYNEKFLKGEFERVSLGSEFPIIKLDFTTGLRGVLNSDYDYYKLHINIQYDFPVHPIGRLNLEVQGGKIWNPIPYPLLRLHEGNETYAFDEYSYNMMNYYEFVSDAYASLYAEHHFEGFFLNKVPLFRRLKWREIVYTKALVGELNPRTYNIMDFPSTLSSLSRPYFEVGVGLENIFKVLRIDAIWRLSYLDHPNIEVFGIRAKLQLIF